MTMLDAPPSDALENQRQRIEFLARSIEDPLAADGPNVIRNLSKTPKAVSAMYVYDKRGTELFERQCLTAEYYLRRVEAALLREHAAEIVEHCGFLPIVELGAGTADKTRILFAEYEANGVDCHYFPIDVDTETLSVAAKRLIDAFPNLMVHCLGTTYEQGLRTLPSSQAPRLYLCLGSSIGNMQWHEIVEFLADLHLHMPQGSYFLVGADLDKDPAIINSAYNDAAGYGPRSTMNILAHLNRRYGGDFALDQYCYRSSYNAALKKNEVHIESLVEQVVTLRALDFRVAFSAGELIDAEIMWKFEPDGFVELLGAAGFLPVRRWIQAVYQYGLFLFVRE
jgi:L-histidine Nalpha-methyltransferase